MNKKSGLIKHPCPNCNNMVYWHFGLPGKEHCEVCATDEQVSKSKSLRELNLERDKNMKCINCKIKEPIQGTSLCQSCLGVAVGNHASMLGKLGGLATKKKYGKTHYQRLAQNMNKKLGRSTGDNPENTKG